MIRLNCFFTLSDEEKKKEFATLAQELVEKSRADDGCVAYGIFFSCTDPLVGMICETWRDQVALDAHSSTPEFSKYVAEIQACGQMKLEQFEF